MAEIELGDIAVKMLLGAMLIHAYHAALENGIEALSRVDADAQVSDAIGVRIFLAGVVNHIMRFEVFSKVAVGV